MYMRVLEQASIQELVGDAGLAALPDRYYTRLQVRGLLCWLAHVRLRDEPKERFDTLYREMMEKVWDQATLDLSRGEFQMCACSKGRCPVMPSPHSNPNHDGVTVASL